MNENIRIAKELVRLAKEIAAADEDKEKEALKKKFENFTLGGKTADECLKNAEEWKKLCEEWNKKYPEELTPVPGAIEIDM